MKTAELRYGFCIHVAFSKNEDVKSIKMWSMKAPGLRGSWRSSKRLRRGPVIMKAGERESGNEDSKDNMNMMEQPGWLPGVASSECIRKMPTRRRDSCHQVVHQDLLAPNPMVREGDLKGRVAAGVLIPRCM